MGIKKEKQAAFIHEIPLVVPATVERELEIRFEVARKLYNRCIAELLRRYDNMTFSREYRWQRNARRNFATGHRSVHPKRVVFASGKESNEAKYELRKKFKIAGSYCLGSPDHDLHNGKGRSFIAKIASEIPIWANGHHIGVGLVHALGARAFMALDRHINDPFWIDEDGIGHGVGRPKYLGRHPGLTSLTGRNLEDVLRWETQYGHPTVIWTGSRDSKKLEIPTLLSPDDLVEAHALRCRVRQVRILRKFVRNRIRWFAQLVLDGQPYRKMRGIDPEAKVGVHVTRDVFAVFADASEGHSQMCEIAPRAMITRRSNTATLAWIEQRLAASRREMNPQNYDPATGVNLSEMTPGIRLKWVTSKRYRELRKRKARILGTEAISRRCEIGQRANDVVRLGARIAAVEHDYRTDHRDYGRPGESAKRGRKLAAIHAPGKLIAEIARKAELYGGYMSRFEKSDLKFCIACGKNGITVKAGHLVCGECGYAPDFEPAIYNAFLARMTCGGTLDAFPASAGQGLSRPKNLAWAASSEPISIGKEPREGRNGELQAGDVVPVYGSGEKASDSNSPHRLDASSGGGATSSPRSRSKQSGQRSNAKASAKLKVSKAPKGRLLEKQSRSYDDVSPDGDAGAANVDGVDR